MALIDIVVLAVIGVLFFLVCLRIWRKGTCADCAQGGYCDHKACGTHGHPRKGRKLFAKKAVCPAVKGVDEVAAELSRGVK